MSHRSEGNYVIAADWATNLYFEEHEFCDQFLLLDLRSLENCLTATEVSDNGV